MKISNSRNGLLIADNASEAATFFSRLKGLLGQKTLAPGRALIIRHCSVIHMFFMRFPIDAVFCSADNRVLHLEHQLQPWRISRHVHLAQYVIELPAGRAQDVDLKIGDGIMFG